jgi:hypothetical protein
MMAKVCQMFRSGPSFSGTGWQQTCARALDDSTYRETGKNALELQHRD